MNDVIDPGQEILFGTFLKEFRKRFPITQEALAYKLDASRTYISRIENNRSNPSRVLLAKFYELALPKDTAAQLPYGNPSIDDWTIKNRKVFLEGHYTGTISRSPSSAPKRNYESYGLFNPETIKQHSKSSTSISIDHSSRINEGIEILLASSGKNRLPEGLDALNQIPITLINIAKSADQSDWDALVKYISHLESEIARLKNEVSDRNKRKASKIFVEEAAKTLGGWKAWVGIAGAIMYLTSQFSPEDASTVLGCMEDITPEITDEFWPLYDT